MEFLVDELEATTDGLVLHGIVNDGCVRIGSRFSAVRRMRQGRDRTSPERIDIRVRRIVAYRHVLNELSRGMSGGLLVDVQKSEVNRGDMLIGLDSQQ